MKINNQVISLFNTNFFIKENDIVSQPSLAIILLFCFIRVYPNY